MPDFANTITRAARTLTEQEQRKLLAVTGQRRDGWRDHVIFSVALGAGLREHEILALNVGDVFDDLGRARRRLALRVFKRASQEPAAQEVLLPDTVRAKLEKLLAMRKADGEALTPESPIFVSRLNRRLSARQLRRAFAVWQERAGFEHCFNVHALRHTACTNLYRTTRDLRLTQRFARHKSVTTTTIYTHPSDEELLRSVQTLIC
jgi:integrase/recombinase XerC